MSDFFQGDASSEFDERRPRSGRTPLFRVKASPDSPLVKCAPRTRSERNMDAKTDESAGKCPVMHTTAARANRDWWPNQLNLRCSISTPPCPIRWARRSTTPRNSRSLDLEAAEQGPPRADDGLAGLVAGRLWSLRAAVHPDGVAQRRHLPHRRRPRRRRSRSAALRAAQQLAGQREPRQGAPAAVADQAEVRQQDLLGRPDDSRRQRRPRVDGLQDVRFRRRARRCLGARRGHLLGPRRQVAGRRALQRRP